MIWPVQADPRAIPANEGAGSAPNGTNGRAELLLLNPGVFLRVGEGSSIRLVSGRVTDSQLSRTDLGNRGAGGGRRSRKDSAATVRYRNATISVLKRGFVPPRSGPPRLRVFEEPWALVESGGRRVEVGRARSSLDGVLVATSFDLKE